MAQYTLPDLPYAHNALEPHIDARTMEIHHSKHHQAYVTNLNAALEKHPEFEAPANVDDLLRNFSKIPGDIQTAVRNNGGGHANHSLFWQIMGPNAGGEPSGALGEAIRSAFGDFAAFREKFGTAAKGRFGSGWAWLIADGGSVQVIDTANQDSPLMEGKTPILGLDVWEHAYYLNYQNRRPDYIEAWWNVVRWDEVARRFESVGR